MDSINYTLYEMCYKVELYDKLLSFRQQVPLEQL